MRPLIGLAASGQPVHPGLPEAAPTLVRSSDWVERRRMSKAIIDDVAHLAGVSIKTVSRVVNREANVRPHTRDRVEAAIAQLNYRPRLSARSLAGNRSFMLGLIYARPGGQYVQDIQEGVIEICRPLGYELLIHPGDHRDGNLDSEVSDLILDRRIDGVLLTPPISDHLPVIGLLKQAGIPLVRIAPTLAKSDNLCVEIDDAQAAYAMTAALLALGHRRIGFITGQAEHRAMSLRQDGYRRALTDATLPVDLSLIVAGNNDFDSGERAGQQLLRLAQPPSAIFAANDEMAAGVIKAAHTLGLQIPAQLSVVGFDDAPIACQIWPSLTTIRQPIREMARSATRMLLEHLRGAGNDAPPASELHPARLIMRESTAPPGGGTHRRP